MYGVYQTYYQSHKLSNESESNIAWIGSLQGGLLLIICFFAGPIYDVGYFNGLMYTGAVLVVVGMMMTSICKNYWQILLAQGVAVGIGSGLLYLPGASVISQYFEKKRTFAFGIASVGSNIGMPADRVLQCRLLACCNSDSDFFRRHHLPSRISTTSAEHWLRLGNTDHCLHTGSSIDCTHCLHEATYTINDLPPITRLGAAERKIIPASNDRHAFRLHGDLHLILLHPNLRPCRMQHIGQPRILPPHHCQYWLPLRTCTAKLPRRRLHRPYEHAHQLFYCSSPTCILLDSYQEYCRSRRVRCALRLFLRIFCVVGWAHSFQLNEGP